MMMVMEGRPPSGPPNFGGRYAMLETSSSLSGALENQHPLPPLRRATYVHISDLLSAYNIRHEALHAELERVHREPPPPPQRRQSPQQQSPPLSRGDHDSKSTAAASTTSATTTRLSPPRPGYNLCVQVVDLVMTVDKRRVDGTRVRLADVLVGDETGVMVLRARDAQIDVLQQVLAAGRVTADSANATTAAVVLRNATCELSQGRHLRLVVTSWGKLAAYPDAVASTPAPPATVNHARNYSRIDLRVVVVIPVEEMAATVTEFDDTTESAFTTQTRGSETSSFDRRGPATSAELFIQEITRPSHGLPSASVASSTSGLRPHPSRSRKPGSGRNIRPPYQHQQQYRQHHHQQHLSIQQHRQHHSHPHNRASYEPNHVMSFMSGAATTHPMSYNHANHVLSTPQHHYYHPSPSSPAYHMEYSSQPHYHPSHWQPVSSLHQASHAHRHFSPDYAARHDTPVYGNTSISSHAPPNAYPMPYPQALHTSGATQNSSCDDTLETASLPESTGSINAQASTFIPSSS